jgi:nucleotide-binding universal stress UspA family protein
MRTILVATDNSNIANNALNYAVGLANDTGSKIVLLTTYEMIVSSSYDVAFTSPTSMDVESSIHESHQTKIENIKSKYPALVLESIVVLGGSGESIVNEASKCNAELIVMGVSGMGAITKFILGSTVRSVIHENKFPVLAIPENATYSGIHKTAFAFDHESFKRNKLEVFVKFLHDVKSKVLVVNVVKSLNDIDVKNAIAGLNLDKLLYDVEHTYHYPSDEHIAQKLNEFTKEFNIDCLAIVPHHHSLLDRLFATTTTDKILNHLSIPLLSIPD